MILYADSSGLVKLLLEEPGTPEMQAAVLSTQQTLSVIIAYVELRSALSAAIRSGRVLPQSRDLLVHESDRLWNGVSPIPITGALLRTTGDLAERMHLRAYDAVHLAALTSLRGRDDLVFACWDHGLRAAAHSLGYTLCPEAL